MRFLVASCCILLLFGCKTSPRIDLTESQASHYAELRVERQREAESYTLEEKANYIQQRLHDKMLDTETGLPKKFIRSELEDSSLNIELAASYLAVLAYQHVCEPSNQTQRHIQTLLKGIQAADASNGYDGYLPTKLRRQGDQLIVTRNETHMNLYTQLLYAYTLTLEFVKDEAIQDSILKHMELIFTHLLKYDFQLHDETGLKMPYSNLRISHLTINPADRLDGSVFLAVATHYLPPHSAIYPQLMKKKTQADRIYKNVGPLHFDFGMWEIPNASSSWLALLSLDTLCQIEPATEQRGRLLKLAHKYDTHQNPLFLGLIAKHDPHNRATFITKVEARLQQVPYKHLSTQMVNSDREDLEITTNHYVKRSRYPRSSKPLPLYEIDSDGYLWKRDLLKLDYRRPAGRTYSGIDYLHAYWQLRYVQQL